MNIFKSFESCDLKNKFEMPKHGDLTGWAKQGVLLLNSVLTIEKGMSNSHKGLKWSLLTNEIISIVSKKCSNVVFMLWGLDAQRKKELIDEEKHLIVRSTHPSPMSANRMDAKTRLNF